MNTYVETLVIGAGQAGLATGYHLQRLGRDFLVVDGSERVGDGWRSHWDSLTLYSPVRYDALPGMPFPGEPWSFPGKDVVADYLEQYAVEMDLPVRLRTRVESLRRLDDGTYTATIGEETIACDNVVVATGSFGRVPAVPDFAGDLDPGILQLHSSRYLRPSQLQDGPVLVVGASHTGCDLAYELAADRRTILAGPDRGQLPLSWDSPALRIALPVIVFAWKHVLTRRTPMGRKELPKVRHHGAPMLRVKRKHLAERGVERITGRVSGVSGGLPRLDDGRVLDVANVLWCTGYEQDFDWIELPIIGADGWPREYRGVVADAPGLFFCGLSYQYAFSSMVLPGVGRDAAYVAAAIADRAGARAPAATHR
ncbi:NAD(P)/FAD-dependent oxidoreductase [Georgenia halophila]|uniref:NAD(P)/FAD-dependent oxidoreductase n=1 Tax=Georgenia halophila TaxID=620889 RepID=A0ABP8LJE7_9MICO